MKNRRGFRTIAVAGLVLASLVTVAVACQVPVFRFALERWAADPYTLVIVPGDSGELSAAENEVIEFLQSTESEAVRAANLKLRIDDSEPVEKPAAEMRLYYPQRLIGFTIPAIWSGPVTMENARAIIDSPARREIATRILKGESATWVLIESGDREKDDAAAAMMEESVTQAEGELKIPEGVMTVEEAQNASNAVAVNADDILRSEVPLKIDFSLIRISRDDPAEKIFRAMLLNIEDDLGEYASEPMVFPVFGRGRALEPLIGRGIHGDNVLEHSFYLCGACSCEVKDQNPGMDLLVAANWDAAIEGSEVVIEKILPPLEGLAGLAQAAAAADPKGSTPGSANAASVAVADADDGFLLPRTWLLAGAGVLAVLILGSVFILRKNQS